MMTTEKLQHFYELTRKVIQLETMLRNLRNNMDGCTQALKVVPDIVDAMHYDLKKLEAAAIALTCQRDAEIMNVENSISEVENSAAQIYMRLHFIHGLMWDEVSFLAGASGKDAVKQSVHTHIPKLLATGSKRAATPSGGLESLRAFRKRVVALSEKGLLLRTIQARFSYPNVSVLFSGHPLCDIPGELHRLRTEISLLRSGQEADLPDVESFIAAVGDVEAQVYMKLYYIQGLPWDEVAQATNAHSGEAARVRVYNHIKQAQYQCQPNA